MAILNDIAANVKHGDATSVSELVKVALGDGVEWQDILNNSLFSGMQVVGQLFEEEEIFIPEMLMAAKAMNAGIAVLEPVMAGTGQKKHLGKIVLGTVKGDVHDLGKKLVQIMLSGAGFEVIDLGVDVPAERFVDTAKSESAQIVAMSALLTTTMPYMRTVIETINKEGMNNRVKTIVGGACVTANYTAEIGADAYGENAGSAVNKVKDLLGLH